MKKVQSVWLFIYYKTTKGFDYSFASFVCVYFIYGNLVLINSFILAYLFGINIYYNLKNGFICFWTVYIKLINLHRLQ